MKSFSAGHSVKKIDSRMEKKILEWSRFFFILELIFSNS